MVERAVVDDEQDAGLEALCRGVAGRDPAPPPERSASVPPETSASVSAETASPAASTVIVPPAMRT